MRRHVLCLVVLTSIACGGGADSAVGPNGFAGSYALQTLDGHPLPYPIIDMGSDFTFLILSDQLTFDRNGTVTEVDINRTTKYGLTTTDTQKTRGSYVVKDKVVTVGWPSSGVYDYTITGDALSVFEPVFQMTWVYKRQ